MYQSKKEGRPEIPIGLIRCGINRKPCLHGAELIDGPLEKELAGVQNRGREIGLIG